MREAGQRHVRQRICTMMIKNKYALSEECQLWQARSVRKKTKCETPNVHAAAHHNLSERHSSAPEQLGSHYDAWESEKGRREPQRLRRFHYERRKTWAPHVKGELLAESHHCHDFPRHHCSRVTWNRQRRGTENNRNFPWDKHRRGWSVVPQ